MSTGKICLYLGVYIAITSTVAGSVEATLIWGTFNALPAILIDAISNRDR